MIFNEKGWLNILNDVSENLPINIPVLFVFDVFWIKNLHHPVIFCGNNMFYKLEFVFFGLFCFNFRFLLQGILQNYFPDRGDFKFLVRYKVLFSFSFICSFCFAHHLIQT